MKKAFIVYNTRNKTNYFRDHLSVLVDYLSSNDYEIRVHSTTHEKDLFEQVSRLDGYDLIALSGGDGSIHECLCAINKLQKKPKILYLPSGTINDYAYSLSIFPNIDYGIELLKTNQYRNIDIAKVNDTYADYVCAFGPFTTSSYTASAKTKAKFGALAYVVDALADVPKLLSSGYKMKLIIDDEEVIEDEFVSGMISNSTSIAGMRHVFKQNELNDGYYEMLFIAKKHLNNIKNLSTIITSGGITDKINSNKFIYRKVKKLQVICDEQVMWTIDGEKGPEGSINLEVIKDNYQIYARKE